MHASRFYRLFGPALLVCTALGACASCSAPPSAAPPQAEAWVTTGDGQSRLAQQPPLAFRTGSSTVPLQVRVDDAVRYQQMAGFGAALTHSAAHVIAHSPQRDAILRALFSSTEGIGISYVRLAMGASDFVAGPAYTYADAPPGPTGDPLAFFSIAPDEEAIVPLLQQARRLNPALSIMASPWSAPAWMKNPPHLHGGTLRPEFYPAYADYFVRFVQAYAQHGLPIAAVTVQNEPHHTTDSYPTMRMEAAEQAAFIRDALGPAFRQARLDTRILAWDHNWDEPEFPLAVLADAGARAFVDGVAWHCYGGDVAAQAAVQAAYPDVDTYFTECSGGAWDADFGSVLRWNMRNLFIGAVQHGARTVILWNLALDEHHGPHRGGCDNCRGVVTVLADGTFRYEPEYYLIGHLSRFVRPGAFRVEASTHPDTLETVAFLNPDGSRVLVAFNASPQPLDFGVAWNGKQAVYRALPAGAVVTLRWAGAAR